MYSPFDFPLKKKGNCSVSSLILAPQSEPNQRIYHSNISRKSSTRTDDVYSGAHSDFILGRVSTDSLKRSSESFIIGEDTFERLDYDMTYAKFHDWNLKCMSKMSDDDRAWVQGLTSRIGKGNINIVDKETGCEMSVYTIYFDKKKNICIVCPR